MYIPIIIIKINTVVVRNFIITIFVCHTIIRICFNIPTHHIIFLFCLVILTLLQFKVMFGIYIYSNSKAYSLPFFFNNVVIKKLNFFLYFYALKDHIFKLLRIFILFKEFNMDIQTSVFQMKTSLFTVNYFLKIMIYQTKIQMNSF